MKLRDITSIIAERADRAFDVPFQKELEKMVHYWRAEMIRRALNKRPFDRKFFLQSITTEMVSAEDECEELNCKVSKTKLVTPTPIRANGILFDYVGAEDRSNSFGYLTSAMAHTVTDNPYTKKNARYMYRNGYVYVTNFRDLGSITIEGIFEDPTDLARFKCGSEQCYDKDSEYPMPYDITQMVVNSILTNELRLVGQDEKEINVKE
jgi:hypothetical protein